MMTRDVGKGIDIVSVAQQVLIKEKASKIIKISVDKFTDQDGQVEALGLQGVSIEEIKNRLAGRFYQHVEFEDVYDSLLDMIENGLLNEGINELWTILCSAGGTKFDSTNAYTGVGDSNAAFNATQTGLQAAVNKLYKAMDGGYPTYGSAQKATWRSTYGSADANWAWEETTVANGNSDAAKNLNRKVQSLGTKASGTTWILTLEITLS